MTPLFQKFVKFLNHNDKLSLEEFKIAKLHSILFQSLDDKKLDVYYISSHMDISYRAALSLLNILNEYEVIRLEPIFCTVCGKEQEGKENHCCDNCGSKINISEAVFCNLTGLRDDQDKKLAKERYLRESQAKSLSKAWKTQGCISYILFDLVQSELIQKEGDLFYSRVLEIIRIIIYDYALEPIKGQYLLLGEVGDCFKIAFSNPDDIVLFMKTFAKKQIEFLDKFPRIINTSLHYPCINTVANLIFLPEENNQKIDPDTIIFTTLSGAMDFNSSNLTSLFRLSGGIKLNYDNAFKDNNYLCLWLFKDLYEKICPRFSDKTFCFRAGKHASSEINIPATLFTFPGGNIAHADNPDFFLSHKALSVEE